MFLLLATRKKNPASGIRLQTHNQIALAIFWRGIKRMSRARIPALVSLSVLPARFLRVLQ